LEGLFAASRWIAEYSVRPGYERRREAVTGKSVDEVRLLNRAGIPVGRGRIRCEGEWRRLSTASASPGYDLTRGWTRGDNWLASLYLDYSLGRNLTAGGFVRSRWRGGFAPLVSGGVEATATL